MAEDTSKIVAAILSAAVLDKINVADGLEATKEAMRYYRVILRKLERLQADEAAKSE